MLLSVIAAEVEHRFWVTRRLWHAFYRSVSELVPAGTDDRPQQPAPPGRLNGPMDVSDVTLLNSIRIRRIDKSLQMVLADDRREVQLLLAGPGLARVKRMLEVQAERAGWDTAAAMKRMDAEALAGEALRKAQVQQ